MLKQFQIHTVVLAYTVDRSGPFYKAVTDAVKRIIQKIGKKLDT